MYEKEKGLANDFLKGKICRRELIKRFSALGLSASTAGVILNMQASNALAADFDWKQHSGKKIKLLLNKHPYTCLLYTSPSPRDGLLSRMPSSA